MRVLFIRFPLESHYGGAEVQTLSLMKGLRERGHEVVFLGSCPTLLAECKQRAIDYWQLAIGSPPVTKWAALSFVWRQRWMRASLIKAARKLTANCQLPTVIFMLSLSEKLLLTSWAVKNGIKVFWIEHDRIGRWLTMNPWLPKLRKLSQLAITVVVSDLSRDLYLKLGWAPERIASVPNGIDIDRFTRKEPKTYHLTPKTFHIGCIARLTYDKGVDLLIEAVAELSNVTLTIVGQGREERNIRTLIEQHNQKRETRNQITLRAAVPDIREFYHSIDVLVLPSRSHDPFGLVVAEAMAAGVPTIVTDACGIARHLDAGDALIVPAGSAVALRNAIETLLRFPQIACDLANRGPKVVHEKFTLERMIDAYVLLLVGYTDD